VNDTSNPVFGHIMYSGKIYITPAKKTINEQYYFGCFASGFVAMSDFGAENYALPSYLPSRVRCVNIQLVHQCSIGSNIWDDEKTGIIIVDLMYGFF
jgi:hypothetical protein